MLINIGIGTVIFGFAIWTIVRAIRLSKQGRCAGCASKSRCAGSCEE